MCFFYADTRDWLAPRKKPRVRVIVSHAHDAYEVVFTCDDLFTQYGYSLVVWTYGEATATLLLTVVIYIVVPQNILRTKTTAFVQ